MTRGTPVAQTGSLAAVVRIGLDHTRCTPACMSPYRVTTPSEFQARARSCGGALSPSLCANHAGQRSVTTNVWQTRGARAQTAGTNVLQVVG